MSCALKMDRAGYRFRQTRELEPALHALGFQTAKTAWSDGSAMLDLLSRAVQFLTGAKVAKPAVADRRRTCRRIVTSGALPPPAM